MTGSTENDIKVEICSACHPFFTGKQKLVDTAGRLDRFRAKMEASKKLQAEAQKKAALKSQRIEKAEKAAAEAEEAKNEK